MLRTKLIKQAIKGDRKAGIALCDEIARDILFRARILLSNEHDAEDVAQEVLLRVCKGVHQVKEPKAFGGWLNSIVINEARRYMKKSTGQSDVLCLDDYLDTVAEENEELLPQEHLLKKEERKAMMEIIATLPNRQREAIMLYYYENLSVKEAAGIMDISHQNVSLYLKLARNKIKQALMQSAEQTEETTPARLSALAALPAGALLSQTLSAEAAQLNATSAAWVQGALANCKQHYLSLPSTADKAASTTPALAVSCSVAACIVVPLVVAGLVATDIISVRHQHETTPVTEAGALPQTQLEILYTSSTEHAFLNPDSASVQCMSEESGFKILSWTITNEESNTVLYGSESSVLEDAFFQMRTSGGSWDGRYLLTYVVEDIDGHRHEAFSNFQIRSEASEQNENDLLAP